MSENPTEKPDGESNSGSGTDTSTTSNTVEPQAAISSDYKVKGEENIGAGAGVLGYNRSTSGSAYGVEGATDSSDDGAVGVFGHTQAGSGGTHGVRGLTASDYTDSSGVRGENTTGGDGAGVEGYNLGQASNEYTFSAPKGVYGQCDDSFGYGVVGHSTGTGNASVGVFGRTESADSPAVWGINNGSGNGMAIEATGYQSISQISVSAYLENAYSVPDSSSQVLAFDALEYSDWSGGKFDTQTGEFTVPAAGKYHVSASCGFQTGFSSGGRISLKIWVDEGGSASTRARNSIGVVHDYPSNVQISKTLDLATDDVVSVYVEQVSGSSQDLESGTAETYITIDKIG